MIARKIAIVLVSVFFLLGFVELSSFFLVRIGTIVANRTQAKDTSAKEIDALYELGLPKTYAPRGSPKHGAWKWSVLMSASPAYNGYDWAEEFWRDEHERYRSYTLEPSNIFQPDVIWRLKPRDDKYVKISEAGVRNTVNHAPANYKRTKKVFMFGGSTLMGTGVPDEFTIPSLLSKRLNETGDTFYQVTNFGTGSFVLDQDKELLFDEIRKGNVPNIAIFYHGANDSYAGVYSPGRPGWYLGSEQLKEKLYHRDNTASKGSTTHWYKELHTYRLLGLLKRSILARFATAPATETISKTSRTDRDQYFLEDYGPRAERFIAYYKETIRLITSICDRYGIRAVFIWQPTLLYTKKKLNSFEQSMLDNPALISIGNFREQEGVYQEKAIRATYRLLSEAHFDGIGSFHNLSNIFDDVDEPIYIDWVHLGPRGNEIIAKRMAGIIRPQAAR
jgi:hypothetical protein